MDFELDIPNVSYIFLQLHIHKDIIRIQVVIAPYIDDWIFFFFLVYNIVLVLPHIDLNPPRVF